MVIRREIYVGGIIPTGGPPITIVAPTHDELLYELNLWFFSYYHASSQPTQTLPPMDDWKHSQENDYYWYVEFPVPGWNVWIRHEFIQFK